MMLALTLVEFEKDSGRLYKETATTAAHLREPEVKIAGNIGRFQTELQVSMKDFQDLEGL